LINAAAISTNVLWSLLAITQLMLLVMWLQYLPAVADRTFLGYHPGRRVAAGDIQEEEP
jgi:hypothetical protein